MPRASWALQGWAPRGCLSVIPLPYFLSILFPYLLIAFFALIHRSALIPCIYMIPAPWLLVQIFLHHFFLFSFLSLLAFRHNLWLDCSFYFSRFLLYFVLTFLLLTHRALLLLIVALHLAVYVKNRVHRYHNTCTPFSSLNVEKCLC